MWRLLQNIPRAVRNHWNSHVRSGPSVYHDGEQSSNTQTTNPISTQPPKVSPQICRYDSGTGQEQTDNKQHGHSNSKQYYWWNHHPNFWNTHQPHTPLEAVCWGTAILFGVQFSHLWKGWYSCGVAHSPEQRRQQCILGALRGRFAFAMPGSPYMIQYCNDTLGKSQEKPDHHTKQLQNESGTADEELDQASKEWEDLSTEYVSKALTQLGLRHAQMGDMTEAMGLWRKASDIGFSGAHFNIGLAFETGHGVQQDFKKAEEHYKIAAEQGHTKALYNLGVMYLRGEEGVCKDPASALSLLEDAAQQGLKQAQTEVGVLYTEEERKDMKKASSFFQMAAEQNDPEAKYYLGICYEQGWGVQCNQCKAAQLYSEAAKDGHVPAQYNLAVFFEHGMGGLPADLNTALELYKKCASAKDSEAEKAVARLQHLKHSQTLPAEIEESRLQYDGGTTGGQHQSHSVGIPRGLRHSQSSPSQLSSPSSSSSESPSFLHQVKQHLLNSLNAWDIDLHVLQNNRSDSPVRVSGELVKFFIGDGTEGGDTLNDSSTDGQQSFLTNGQQTLSNSSGDMYKLSSDLGSLNQGQRSFSMMDLHSGLNMDLVPCK